MSAAALRVFQTCQANGLGLEGVAMDSVEQCDEQGDDGIKPRDHGLEPRDGLEPRVDGLASGSRQADVAAGINDRCNNDRCVALPCGPHVAVAAYDGSRELTPCRSSTEAGYLTVVKGDSISVLNGIPQRGHEGNVWPWYVYGVNAQLVMGWLPAGILIPSAFLADDDDDDEPGQEDAAAAGDDFEAAFDRLNLLD